MRKRSGRCALVGVMVLAVVAVLVPRTLAAAAPLTAPDLSGQWSFPSSPSSPPWTLESSSDGTILHAAWTGGAGHSDLHGSFEGGLTTLADGHQAYQGTLRIIEGDLDVTGSMTFEIVNANELLMSYQQSNGPSGSNAKMVRLHPVEQGWTFQLQFAIGHGLAGHGEGSSCLASQGCEPIPPSKQASFVENACTPQCTYAGPKIDLVTTSSHLTVAPLSAPPGYITNRNKPQVRTLTFGVKVYNSSDDMACPNGDIGTALVVDRDMINQSSNVHSDKFSLGGWAKPCAGNTFTLDAVSPKARGAGSLIGTGQFFIIVSIACYAGNAWSADACELT